MDGIPDWLQQLASAAPPTPVTAITDLERHQRSQVAHPPNDPYAAHGVGVFPMQGARPAHYRSELPAGYPLPPAVAPGPSDMLIQAPSNPNTNPNPNANVVPNSGMNGNNMDAFTSLLMQMPTGGDDPTKLAMWNQLVQLKTKTLELETAESKRKEREAELELARLKGGYYRGASQPPQAGSSNFTPIQTQSSTPQQIQQSGRLSQDTGVPSFDPNALSFNNFPIVSHARPTLDDNLAQELAALPQQDADIMRQPGAVTPFDIEAMLQENNLDNLFSWLPDYHASGESSAAPMARSPETGNPLVMPTMDEKPFHLNDSSGNTPSKRRPSSAASASSDHAPKKAKRAERKAVIEHPTNCQRCNVPLGRVIIRAPKSQPVTPVVPEMLCPSCKPLDPVPPTADPSITGAAIGTVETRKRSRTAMENEDEGKPEALRRLCCDVCQRVYATGMVLGGPEKLSMSSMAEMICASCDAKYQRCTDCGGGGGLKIGIGKWRMKQVFQPGRKTCSLNHNRIGDRMREIGVHVTPTDFTREQLKEVLSKCRALWNEKSLARLAVPEMLEVDLPPGLVNPLQTYQDVEENITSGWPTRESMIRAEDADPEKFKRILGLIWAHSKPRRSVRTVDLEDEFRKAEEGEDEEDNSTVLANVIRTNVAIPPGSELIGMWGGEWDMDNGSLLISTFISFESTDGEDSTALIVGEMITTVQDMQAKINRERTEAAVREGKEPQLLQQCQHLWTVSASAMPLVRERMADILIRKRAFVQVDEYLTRHPEFINSLNARPLGMHPSAAATRAANLINNRSKPLILVRWLGKDFDAQQRLEIKRREFGAKISRMSKKHAKNRAT